MEKLQETITLREFKVEDKIPKSLEKLPRVIKDIVIAVEKQYSEITTKVNWLLSAKPAVEAHTGDDSLLENESGSVHTNLGATGAVTLTLPGSATKGTHYKFAVQATQELRIDPGTATIRDDSGQTANKYKTANAIGECIEIIADANGDWATISKYGTWTEEA